MSADILLRVGRALKDLIEADPDVGAEKVALGPPPATSSKLDGPRLGLFLYRLEPAASLRNRERLLPPARPGETARGEAGLPLDLRFLLTAFGPEDERAFAAEQLILLGGALRAIERGAMLTGELLPDQAARLTLDPLSGEELSRIWSLFPNTAFQTSVGLLVSPVWLGWDKARPAAPVTGGGFEYAVGRSAG